MNTGLTEGWGFARFFCYLALGLALTACATTQPREVVKLVPIPPEMTAPVPAPELQGDQNKDLVSWIDRWREALKEANRRLAEIGNIKPE